MKIISINIKNYNYDDYIYVGRPSKYGNPISSKGSNLAIKHVKSRKESLKEFRKYINNNKQLIKDLIQELKDKKVYKLGCWCKPADCHSDILIEMIENYKYKSIF